MPNLTKLQYIEVLDLALALADDLLQLLDENDMLLAAANKYEQAKVK